MASSKEYLEYVLELLRNVNNISYKKMMGEYLLYCDNKLFGGIYDDRFLVKKNDVLVKYNLSEEIPYDNAKSMYLIDIEDSNKIRDIILELVEWL